MTEKTIKRIRLTYGVLLGLSIAAAGLCLMAACIEIYYSGDQPFSREAVAAQFCGIAVPVYLCLAMVIGGFILDFVLPAAPKKTKAAASPALTLSRLLAKADLDQCGEALCGAIRTQEKTRKLHWCISTALLILGSAIFLCYALNPNNFHQSEINRSMVNAMYVLLPCLAVPFAYAVFSAYYAKASIQKEIALTKQVIAQGGHKDTKKAAQPKPAKDKAVRIARYAIVALGIVMVIYGFCSEGTRDVLAKAVNICTECVGLG